MGWSWGTVTASRYAAVHPERLRHIVLYAPILSGLGAKPVTEPFNHNNWIHRNSDFQLTSSGDYDFSIVDPQVLHFMSSQSWRYDGEFSPNGGRRDLLVAPEVELIQLRTIKTPTLVIAGDHDPYLDYARLKTAPAQLPAGSRLELIPSAAHMLMVEKPFYHDFLSRLLSFLNHEL
ncbi:MAG: alpha/beta hydrolase [Succinivibrio sp.]|nr:alpha/beta hydrolase [Succinivibrio sp.]